MAYNAIRSTLYLVSVVAWWIAAPALAGEVALPELGDASSAYVSPVVERRLGQAWLRAFRSQVETVSDPLLADYLEHLVFRLSASSPLKEAPLSLVIVRNETINAFAVPGGVVGIHDGLLLAAQHEDELASVIAHELAHLSQRHFARSVEQQARSQIPTMLAMLSSLVIAATVGGDAGMAAVTATQAAALQSRLRFSRQNEQEADRIGLQTLAAADMDPEGMPRMFQRMLDSMRLYGSRPPEFLLTHPVTESRVADSRGRAEQLPKPPPRDETDFQMMRARVLLSYEANPNLAIQKFQARLDSGKGHVLADRYGLALAYLKKRDLDAARSSIDDLLARDPNRITTVILAAELESSSKHYDSALHRLRGQLRLAPENHPLTMSLAKILQEKGDYFQSAEVLQAHVSSRPEDPQVWYELAEAQGLAGNILGVHKARAEYFLLVGALDSAKTQLGYALNLVRGDFHQTARIHARMADIDRMRDELNPKG